MPAMQIPEHTEGEQGARAYTMETQATRRPFSLHILRSKLPLQLSPALVLQPSEFSEINQESDIHDNSCHILLLKMVLLLLFLSVVLF